MSKNNLFGEPIRKGDLFGMLQHTLVERGGPEKGYRWVNVLAVLDKDGRWLYTKSWSQNAYKQASEELTRMGWEPLPEGFTLMT